MPHWDTDMCVLGSCFVGFTTVWSAVVPSAGETFPQSTTEFTVRLAPQGDHCDFTILMEEESE